MPPNWEDCAIIFLLGNSGAGKSTTLAFLRGDKMERRGSCYVSKDDQDDVIGDARAVSCTFLPNVETTLGGRIIVDFAGFNKDSHGPYVCWK